MTPKMYGLYSREVYIGEVILSEHILRGLSAADFSFYVLKKDFKVIRK